MCLLTTRKCSTLFVLQALRPLSYRSCGPLACWAWTGRGLQYYAYSQSLSAPAQGVREVSRAEQLMRLLQKVTCMATGIISIGRQCSHKRYWPFYACRMVLEERFRTDALARHMQYCKKCVPQQWPMTFSVLLFLLPVKTLLLSRCRQIMAAKFSVGAEQSSCLLFVLLQTAGCSHNQVGRDASGVFGISVAPTLARGWFLFAKQSSLCLFLH